MLICRKASTWKLIKIGHQQNTNLLLLWLAYIFEVSPHVLLVQHWNHHLPRVCSWRVTWPLVSERLSRGNFWRWKACTAKCVPATPSSRLLYAGSEASSDSPKAESSQSWTIFGKNYAKHNMTATARNIYNFLSMFFK